MRVIKRVEMACDDSLSFVLTGEKIEVLKIGDLWFSVFLDGVQSYILDTRLQAYKVAKSCIIDDFFIISGRGKYSGCRFYELPMSIQSRVLSIGLKS